MSAFILILERRDGRAYAYREAVEQFEFWEAERLAAGSKLLAPDVLDYECRIRDAASGDWHMVFEVVRHGVAK